jgi:heme/copper-type cytochrome/quinol oxidase subunit 3
MNELDEAPIIAAHSRIGVRLFASAIVFTFMAFVFAFFYLRALNSDDNFHETGVNPPQGYGIAILVCILATCAVWEYSRRALGSGATATWRPGSAVALALGVVVVVLQILEYISLKWTTSHGGLASVFWGWTILFTLFWLGAVFWMETLVAQSARFPDTVGSFVRPSADACVVYLWTSALVAVFSYVLLYLVK